MRRRTLLFIAGLGVMVLLLAVSIRRPNTSSSASKAAEHSNLESSPTNPPANSGIEAESTASKAQSISKALTPEEKTVFDLEINELTSLFQKWEREFCTIVFEGERNGVTQRNVRINTPDRERLDQMAGAYSAVLRRYPEDSNLHTALWKRINELMADYSRERMLFFTQSGDYPWALGSEVRSTSANRDVGAVTSGIPDENGRLTFTGPNKFTLISSPENPKISRDGKSKPPASIDRYKHLLDP